MTKKASKTAQPVEMNPQFKSALLSWVTSDPEIRGLVLHQMYSEWINFSNVAKHMDDYGFSNTSSDAVRLKQRQEEIAKTILIAMDVLGGTVEHVLNRLNTNTLDIDVTK